MKKPIITVDIETYSPQDIAKVGAYRYAQDPDFQILLLGYVNEDLDTPTVIDLTTWPDTAHFLREQLPWLPATPSGRTMLRLSGGACRRPWA